jgi:hypothetical protein
VRCVLDTPGLDRSMFNLPGGRHVFGNGQ